VQQTYKIGRYVFGVRTNSKRLGNWLNKNLADYVSTKNVDPMYSLVVGKHKKGGAKEFNILYRDTLVLSRTLDLEDAVRTLLSEFESLAFAEWDEGIYVEAALASSNGATALIPNLAAIRLSDVAREARRAGLSVPPTGRVAIEPDSGQLIPIPPLFSAVPAERFEALASIGPQNGKPRRPMKAAADVSTVDTILLPAPAPWDQDTPDPVRPLSRAVALQKFAEEQVVNLGVTRGRALEGLARMVERAQCYEILHHDGKTLLNGVLAAMHGEQAPTLIKPKGAAEPDDDAMVSGALEPPAKSKRKPKAKAKT
jgi:hypothetical protein